MEDGVKESWDLSSDDEEGEEEEEDSRSAEAEEGSDTEEVTVKELYRMRHRIGHLVLSIDTQHF